MSEIRALFAIDRHLSDEVLKRAAYRQRGRRIEWMRHAVQTLWAVVVLAIGWQFVRWVHGLEAGRIAGSRPPGVEGFLPISGLMSLRHLAITGEIHPVHPAALVLVLLALVLSLLLKKAFCSWVCPLGTLSELLLAAGRRIFRRSFALPRWLDVPLRGLKYLLLAFFVWAIFFVMSPLALAQFLDGPYNRVADVKMLGFFAHLTPFATWFLVVVAAASLLVPLFWCRYLCPYGALLGLVSLLSPFKITRRASSCIDCGLCARACPARLPVDALRRVRSAECAGCLSCVAACPVTSALQLEAPRGLRLRPAIATLIVLALFLGGIGWARWSGHWRTSVGDREYLERLPHLDQPEYEHVR